MDARQHRRFQGIVHIMMTMMKTMTIVMMTMNFLEKYPSMEIGELGAHGTVLKPAEEVTSTGGALVLTQPLRMRVVTVKGPASRSRLRLVMYSGVQRFMVTGALGTLGVAVAAERKSRQEYGTVLTLPRNTEEDRARGRNSRQRGVILVDLSYQLLVVSLVAI